MFSSLKTLLPTLLDAGDYVLRHELIALHFADRADGAQAYPRCVNLRVEGKAKGKGEVEGLAGGVRAKGILLDVHKIVDGLKILGPRAWEFAERVGQPGEVR